MENHSLIKMKSFLINTIYSAWLSFILIPSIRVVH